MTSPVSTSTSFSTIATKTFTIPTASSSISIKISEPNLRADGLSLETWAASHVLASLLHKFRFSFPSITPKDYDILPVLEIGAGTGLVGLSAENIWQKPVVLTDLEPITPGLQQNIDLNFPPTDTDELGKGEDIRCGTLDWKSPSILSMHPDKRIYFSSTTKAHVILAADTVYSEEHPQLLLDVVRNWLNKDLNARVVVAYPMRVAYLDEIRDLWSKFEEGGLESIEEGRVQAEGAWDDEGLVEWTVWRWRDEVLGRN